MSLLRRLCRMRGADLIREARLRAGLTQAELSARTGRQGSVVARWEQGAVSPRFDHMLAGVEACGLDIVPSTRRENRRRLDAALRELDARRADGRPAAIDEQTIASDPVLELQTGRGGLKIVPEPVGTRGYDDLRRAATREPLGR